MAEWLIPRADGVVPAVSGAAKTPTRCLNAERDIIAAPLPLPVTVYVNEENPAVMHELRLSNDWKRRRLGTSANARFRFNPLVFDSYHRHVYLCAGETFHALSLKDARVAP